MPTTVVESSAFPSSLSVPDDGEDADQSSVLTTFVQPITNRTRFLRNRSRAALVEGTAYGWRMDDKLMEAAVLNKTDNVWIPHTGFWLQSEGQSGVDPCVLTWSLPIIPGAFLKEVAVWIHGDILGSGAHGGLPVGMPQLAVYDNDSGASGPNVSVAGSVTDTPGSVGAYETGHKLEVTGLNLQMDTSFGVLSAALAGEYSTNALDLRLGCYSIELVVGDS